MYHGLIENYWNETQLADLPAEKQLHDYAQNQQPSLILIVSGVGDAPDDDSRNERAEFTLLCNLKERRGSNVSSAVCSSGLLWLGLNLRFYIWSEPCLIDQVPASPLNIRACIVVNRFHLRKEGWRRGAWGTSTFATSFVPAEFLRAIANQNLGQARRIVG